MKETLLNGDHENYNMDYGYTLHMINDTYSEGITGKIYTQRCLKNLSLKNIYYTCLYVLSGIKKLVISMISFGIRLLIFLSVHYLGCIPVFLMLPYIVQV